MKYKVGDKVRVRTDLIEDKIYGAEKFILSMFKFKGKICTIKEIYDKYYLFEEDDDEWYWTDEMLEDVSDDENETQTVNKARTVDVGYYLNTYGHRVIKNVYQGADNGKLFFTTADGLNQYILSKDAIEWVVPHEG